MEPETKTVYAEVDVGDTYQPIPSLGLLEKFRLDKVPSQYFSQDTNHAYSTRQQAVGGNLEQQGDLSSEGGLTTLVGGNTNGQQGDLLRQYKAQAAAMFPELYSRGEYSARSELRN